jgi:hypothetical protein
VRTLFTGIRGLTIVKLAVQIAAYSLIAWTYAERKGLEDALVDGLKGLLRLPADLLRWAVPGGANA